MQDDPNFNVNDEFGASIRVCTDPSDPTCQTRVILRQPAVLINYGQIPIPDVAESALFAASASYAITASHALSINSTNIKLDEISGSVFALRNYTFPQNLTIVGSLTVGQIIASSSVIYSSGSTKFGDSIDDVHQFTGSLSVKGNISGNLVLPTGTVSSSVQINTGSFSGSITTASYAEYVSYIDGGFY
jgi:hypothetical protein